MDATTIPQHTSTLLTRLHAVEAEAREAMRTIRYAMDDLASAHETARQLRAELAAVLGVEDVSAAPDASQTTDPIPTAAEYIAAIRGGDPCGRVRR